MIGIICAMEEESKELEASMTDSEVEVISSMKFKIGKIQNKKCVLALSGIGKVHAAMCAQTMILKYKPDFILNLGTAGAISTKVKICDVVITRNVIQYDFDVSAFEGRKKGQIPGINIVEIPCSFRLGELALEAAKKQGISAYIGNVLTGDRFIDDKNIKNKLSSEFKGLACEMECASIGHVCHICGVEFLGVKLISDCADDGAENDFDKFMEKAPRIIKNIAENLIKDI